MKNKAEKFIVVDQRKSPDNRVFYVCAPAGYYREENGNIKKDQSPSPEWSLDANKVYVFSSHRSAARTANKCISAEIKERNW